MSESMESRTKQFKTQIIEKITAKKQEIEEADERWNSHTGPPTYGNRAFSFGFHNSAQNRRHGEVDALEGLLEVVGA